MNDLSNLKRDVYTVKTEGLDYMVVKFDPDLNVANIYHITHAGCDCPAAQRNAHCKHQEILTHFSDLNRIDSGWFFCPTTADWYPPVGDGAADHTQPAATVPEVESKASA